MATGSMRLYVKIWALFLIQFPFTHAFYIPGWSVKSYRDGQPIPLFVNKIYSDNTQLQYAYSELPFVCSPSGRLRPGLGLISGSNVALNLGEVLRGDRIMVSGYELEMGKDEELRYLCSRKVNKAGLKKAIEYVKEGYVAEWIVDNLPGATSFVTADKSRKYYASGFKIGSEELSVVDDEPRYYINNHVTLVLRYRAAPGRAGESGKKVIVGFEVYAKSIEAENRGPEGLPIDIHGAHNKLELAFTRNLTNSTAEDSSDSFYDIDDIDDNATITIPYTYSVYFREDESIEWAKRWDLYFVNQEDGNQVHWLAIINSLVIAGLLTAVVAVIFARTVHGDLRGYGDRGFEEGKIGLGKRSKSRTTNTSSPGSTGGLLEQAGGHAKEADFVADEEIPEEITGWKLVHGDVFRPPPFALLFAPLVGSGSQLVFMAVGLILLSCCGILNPSFRGGFISFGFALFILAGSLSGYFSARIYSTFGGSNWRFNAIVTATLFPGLIFATIFILNLFVWAQASSTAIPLTTLVGLLALWLCIQLPLVYFGSWYGFVRAGAYSHPIKATAVPRQIPLQVWYSRSFQAILAAGLLPFTVVFIELLYVFRSLWQDRSGYYNVFGFLAVVSIILILAIMETTIIAVYVQLCSENYHWWWQSFFIGGASSIWIFAYSIYYYAYHLHISGFTSSFLFFTYSFLVCLVYGLLTGTIGFLTAYAFVRRIFAAIKVD